MTTVEIWYGVLRTSIVDAVTIARDALVIDLREAIFKQVRLGPRGFVPGDLGLFLPRSPDPRLQFDENLTAFVQHGQVSSSEFKELEPLPLLVDPEGFGGAFPPDTLHVLVEFREI